MVAYKTFFTDACDLTNWINANGGLTSGSLNPFTPTITEVLSSCGLKPTMVGLNAPHPLGGPMYNDAAWQSDLTNLRIAINLACQSMLTGTLSNDHYTAARVLIDTTVAAVLTNRGADGQAVGFSYGPISAGPHTIEVQYWRDSTISGSSGGPTLGVVSLAGMLTRW